MALCYDCSSEDVAVKLIDIYGFEHYFCARDWEAEQRFSEKLHEYLREAVTKLDV